MKAAQQLLATRSRNNWEQTIATAPDEGALSRSFARVDSTRKRDGRPLEPKWPPARRKHGTNKVLQKPARADRPSCDRQPGHTPRTGFAHRLSAHGPYGCGHGPQPQGRRRSCIPASMRDDKRRRRQTLAGGCWYVLSPGGSHGRSPDDLWAHAPRTQLAERGRLPSHPITTHPLPTHCQRMQHHTEPVGFRSKRNQRLPTVPASPTHRHTSCTSIRR